MTDQKFLDSGTQTIAWFASRLRNDELELKPPFQRNPVWVTTQKSALIDTILRGYPIPEIYLQLNFSAEGAENYVVVDGQQRIRACLEFLDNEYQLQLDGTPWDGLTFDGLTKDEQNLIRGYRFVTRMLPSMDDALLRDVFGRLNRNNMSLTAQELRQATYWGEFISSVNQIAEHPFWVDKSGLFTANDYRRMLDREYISELVILALFGPQNKKTTLDRYYTAFEEEFPRRQWIEDEFRRNLEELSAVFDSWTHWNRWSKKSDFYTLLGVLVSLEGRKDQLATTPELADRLAVFSDAVDEVLSLTDDDRAGRFGREVVAYARAVQRAASDLANRRIRHAALLAHLTGEEYVPPSSSRPTSQTLDVLEGPITISLNSEDEDE